MPSQRAVLRRAEEIAASLSLGEDNAQDRHAFTCITCRVRGEQPDKTRVAMTEWWRNAVGS